MLSSLLKKEQERHTHSINLIASENYPSSEVRTLLSSIFGTKYAEGFPHKRYYAGCTIVDELELYAEEQALLTFVPPQHRSDYAISTQPHSGSQANQAVFLGVLHPGDTILSMGLTAGGHLTHGHPLSLTGQLYSIISYEVDPESNMLNYNMIRELAHIHRPRLIIAGGSAYSRLIDFDQFRIIADEVGALLMADIAHIAGFVVTGLHPTPFPFADIVTTTTHKTLRGPRGGLVFMKKPYEQSIKKALMPGIQGGPFMNVIAAKAQACLEAQSPPFQEYQTRTQACARTLSSALIEKGYRIITHGTDTHLFLMDLHDYLGRGKGAEKALLDVGIVVNRNTIPFEQHSALNPSGIRIGLAALATRNAQPHEMHHLATLIDNALKHQNLFQTISAVQTYTSSLSLP